MKDCIILKYIFSALIKAIGKHRADSPGYLSKDKGCHRGRVDYHRNPGQYKTKLFDIYTKI